MRRQRKQDESSKDGSLGGVTSGSASTGLSEQSTAAGNHVPLYLFACHLEWHRRRNLGAYQELVVALDDSDKKIREIAEELLHRSSPRPQRGTPEVYPG
jgi:hypothetical protein